MPANWYADDDLEKASLFRDIQTRIGGDLKTRYEVPQELPREMLALVRQIEKTGDE